MDLNLTTYNMKMLEITKYNKRIKIVKQQSCLEVTGPLGTIKYQLTGDISADLFCKNKSINFLFNKIKKLFKSVSSGWFRELNFNGIGYKSFKIKDKLALDLGYSTLILYKPIPEVKIKNLKGKIILFSINEELLNNVAFQLRKFAVPDKYKGKGILLGNEQIKLKKKVKT